MIERLENGLSAETRHLIAAARGADDPSAEDEARVRARCLASIAAGAGVSSLTEAAHAAAGAGWGLKVAGVAVAVAAASAGLYLGWPATSGNSSMRSVAARQVSARDIPEPSHLAQRHTGAAAVVAEKPAAAERGAGAPAAGASLMAPAAEPVPIEPQAKQLATTGVNPPESGKSNALGMPEGSRVVSAAEASGAQTRPLARAAQPPPSRAAGSSFRARIESPERAAAVEGAKLAPAQTVKAPSDVGGQLGEEINLLSRVRTSIQARESSQALQLLGEYGQRFEHPTLAMEADALRIDALCGAGQREAARERAAHFVATWPGSPLEQRVRDACP